MTDETKGAYAHVTLHRPRPLLTVRGQTYERREDGTWWVVGDTVHVGPTGAPWGDLCDLACELHALHRAVADADRVAWRDPEFDAYCVPAADYLALLRAARLPVAPTPTAADARQEPAP